MSTQTQNKKRVIGIDPGFDRAGLAVLEKDGGTEKVCFSTCVTTSPKNAHAERLEIVGSALRKAIQEWKPDALAIETLFFNQNTTTALKVAEARGVILYEAACAGIEVYEYSPQSVKIAVTGYGKATKEQMNNMVTRLVQLKVQPKYDDEIDAIAVGITHLVSQRGSIPSSK